MFFMQQKKIAASDILQATLVIYEVPILGKF